MSKIGLTINNNTPIPEEEMKEAYIYPALWENLHGQYFIEIYFDYDVNKWSNKPLTEPEPKWMFTCFENIDDIIDDQVLLKIKNNRKKLENICIDNISDSLRSLSLIFQFKVIPPHISRAFLNFFTAKVNGKFISNSLRTKLAYFLPGASTNSFDEVYTSWKKGNRKDNTFYAITPNDIYHYDTVEQLFNINNYKEVI